MDTAEATWNKSLSPGSGRLGELREFSGGPVSATPEPSQPGAWVSHSLLISWSPLEGKVHQVSQFLPLRKRLTYLTTL